MKDVTIYSSASCDWNSREGRFFTALEYQGQFKYITGLQTETTADRCILTGFLESLHLINEPCNLILVTATRIAFNRLGNPRGRNKELKELLLKLVKDKDCEFKFDVWTGGGDRLKSKLADIQKVAKLVSPIDVVAHYRVGDKEPPDCSPTELPVVR
jgi:hypothetical protein